MTKKLTLTTPESRPSITEHRVLRVNLDVSSLGAEVSVVKFDEEGTQVEAYNFEIALLEADVTALVAAVLSKAQSDGKMPAGVVGNA